MEIKPKQINMIVMAAGLVIILLVATHYWGLRNTLSSSIPSDYSSGIECPVYSRECECTGQEIGKEAVSSPLFGSMGGSSIETYCMNGITTDCKCYKDECPIGNREEIACTELGLA